MANIDKLNINGVTYNITDTTSGFMAGLTQLTYGTSTWNDFITAYNAKKVVYCLVSGRMAFMAYVNNSGNNPTEVEFQYVRSRNGHTDNYQGDQVYVYKLTSAGTWTTTTRNSYTKIDTEKGLTDTYTTGTVDSVAGQGILKIKANLRSETALANDSASATEVAGRVYPVALDHSGYLAVNVPWESGGGSEYDVVFKCTSTSGFTSNTADYVLESGDISDVLLKLDNGDMITGICYGRSKTYDDEENMTVVSGQYLQLTEAGTDYSGQTYPGYGILTLDFRRQGKHVHITIDDEGTISGVTVTNS